MSFDEAKDSSIARSHWSRKRASHPMPHSHTANIWLNAGESEQPSGEKWLRHEVAGWMDISFLGSMDSSHCESSFGFVSTIIPRGGV
jgi:hypothetical protein